MNDSQKLNYETPQPKQRFRLPPDWRRRLIVAVIAGTLVLLVTLDASRRAQSSAISYVYGGGSMVNIVVREMQNDVDSYTRTNGQAPATLTQVPGIQKHAAASSSYLVDHWRTPYQLISINGQPTVISYGRDKVPGGSGLDADITVHHPGGSELVTMNQFIQTAGLLPVILLCAGNALLVAFLSFAGTTDTREARGLGTLLLQISVKATMAIFVASLIASVHAPSGH